MTLVNGMQVKKAQGRAEVVYDGCQPLVAVENGLKLDWQSWEAAEDKKPPASQQQRITVLARGPPTGISATPLTWVGTPLPLKLPTTSTQGPFL